MFKQWLEAIDLDIYGADELDAKVRKPAQADDDPIQALAVTRIMKHLLKLRIANIKPIERFDDEIRWGEHSGSVRVKLTPNASIVISQATNDLNGNIVWVCKGFYHLDAEKFTGHEEALAKEIYEKILEVAKQPIDNTTTNYTGLINLVKEVARMLRVQLPEIYTYDEIKQVSIDEFIIMFSVRGVGHGKVVRQRQRGGNSPFMNVDISFNPNTGCIRVILTTTTIAADGGGWDIDIPFFDEKFMPSQDSKNVIAPILTAIRFF